MNRLAVGGVSQPVTSRFGVHLIEVVERRDATLDAKQLREQARLALREQKFEAAYAEFGKLDVLVVDFLQRLYAPRMMRASDNRNNEVGKAQRELAPT